MHYRGRSLSTFLTTVAAFAAATSALAGPKRALIGLDGVSYRDVLALQSSGRCFQQFKRPARMISTFPVLSDVAWADIFGASVPNGYQRYHFSTSLWREVGTAISDIFIEREFELAMEQGFTTPGHHIVAYLRPEAGAYSEIEEIARSIRASTSEVFYGYLPSTDGFQHLGLDPEPMLCGLDRELARLQEEYRKRGEFLSIALISDHGNRRSPNGQVADVAGTLERAGFRFAAEVEAPTDADFVVNGAVSVAPVFVKPSMARYAARQLARMEGADLVTYVVPEDPQGVRVYRVHADGKEESALITRDLRPGPRRYKYLPLVGDPLRYRPILGAMRASGALDSLGYATSVAWAKATIDHPYPAAPPRIWRGHREVAKNPAQVLVSLKIGHIAAKGAIAQTARFKNLGNTHGSLDAEGTYGVLIANDREPRDALTDSALAELGFPRKPRP